MSEQCVHGTCCHCVHDADHQALHFAHVKTHKIFAKAILLALATGVVSFLWHVAEAVAA